MYRFCPKCAGKLVAQKPFLLVCSSCHFHFYQNPIPTVGLIFISKKHKILLVKRKFPPKKGYWDIPGGFIEPSESAENSLKREIAEELHFSLERFFYFASYPDRYLYQKVNYFTLCSLYISKIEEKEKFEVGDDVLSWQWFRIKEIPLEKLAFDFLRQAIKDLSQKKII